MKRYKFKREAKYIQYGYVLANSEEDAKEKVRKDEYDESYDIKSTNEYGDYIEIKESEEENE